MTTRFVVRGRVQGVGFRAYVQQVAEGMGVDGEVWNRVDGGVEALVGCGDDKVLDEFERALLAGPGWVGSVDRSSAPDNEFEGFRIGRTR